MATSRFFLHARVWVLIAPIVLAIVVPTVSDPAALEISDLERQSVVAMLGVAGEAQAAAMTDTRFAQWLIDPGLVAASYAGSAQEHGPPVRHDIGDAGASAFGRSWVDRAWLMTYRAIYRLSVAQSWFLGGVAAGLALANDGAVTRRIRLATMGPAGRPVAFHLAAHGLLLCLGLGVCALLYSVPVLAHGWVLLACAVGALCWHLGASYGAGE